MKSIITDFHSFVHISKIWLLSIKFKRQKFKHTLSQFIEIKHVYYSVVENEHVCIRYDLLMFFDFEILP